MVPLCPFSNDIRSGVGGFRVDSFFSAPFNAISSGVKSLGSVLVLAQPPPKGRGGRLPHAESELCTSSLSFCATAVAGGL